MTAWETLAGTVVFISILLSGIAIGIGIALRHKRLERFGIEELGQSIINAALLGSIVLLSHTVSAISVELATNSGYNITNATNVTAIDLALLQTDAQLASTSALLSKTTDLVQLLMYYQSIVVDLGNITIQPLKGFSTFFPLLTLANIVFALGVFFLTLLKGALVFVKSTWMAVAFALGLFLRSFFATRRVGSAIMCLALAFILLYPFFLTNLPSPLEQLRATNESISALLQAQWPPPAPIALTQNGTLTTALYNLSFYVANASLSSSAANNTANTTAFLTQAEEITQELIASGGVVVLNEIVLPLLAAALSIALGWEMGKALASTPIGVDLI